MGGKKKKFSFDKRMKEFKDLWWKAQKEIDKRTYDEHAYSEEQNEVKTYYDCKSIHEAFKYKK